MTAKVYATIFADMQGVIGNILAAKTRFERTSPLPVKTKQILTTEVNVSYAQQAAHGGLYVPGGNCTSSSPARKRFDALRYAATIPKYH